jgi:hypothetical protein
MRWTGKGAWRRSSGESPPWCSPEAKVSPPVLRFPPPHERNSFGFGFLFFLLLCFLSIRKLLVLFRFLVSTRGGEEGAASYKFFDISLSS